ncbi:MAG TPA: PQQ-binding-like beta-propeller repeat protein [Bryobacteraceae bacterium]|nr:PQQ-binding-like beta-propeller repeat protein [Bryobacteraceae bacterium]
MSTFTNTDPWGVQNSTDGSEQTPEIDSEPSYSQRQMRKLALLAALTAIAASATDWTRYRGPNGTGVSPDKGVPTEIGPDKNLAWKAKTPKGNSSPVVLNGRIYLTAEEGDNRILLSIDAKSGTEIWRKSVQKLRTEVGNPVNGNATPTPATDGQSLFVFFPEVGLLGFDTDGKELWRVALGPFGGIQGMAVSPVYAEGNVILLIDTAQQASITAYDARSGKQVWKADRPIGFLGSYSTPSLHRTNGRTEVIVAGAVELTSYDAKTGNRIWWARGVTYGPAALPLVTGDSVYTVEPADSGSPTFTQFSGPYDKNKDGKVELTEAAGERLNDKIMYRLFASMDKNSGNNDGVVTENEFNAAFNPDPRPGGLVRTKLGGKGDVSKTHIVWRHTKGLPYVTAPLVYQGIMYIVRDGGILSAFDPETGKVLHEGRLKDAIGAYYASPVAADGKIYFVSKEGKLTVIKPGAPWEVLASADLAEQVIATPAIAGDRIYVRTEGYLYAFGAAGARPATPPTAGE